jgi:hypothetical protein
MSLTTKRLRQLKAKSFDKLYASAEAKYAEMANKAVDYVQKRSTASDKVLLGDVAEVLKGAVEIDPSFEEHLEKKRLPVDSWSLEFADYILEQVYPQPELRAAPAQKTK